MLGYYLKLGVRNLRRNPLLTALMVLTLAVGVAASISALTLLYVMSGNPMGDRSSRLIVPLLDNASAHDPQPSRDPPLQLTYRDSVALHDSGRSPRSTAVVGVGVSLDAGRPGQRPERVHGVAVHRDFFKMFSVPFSTGSAWSATDDTRGGDFIVLSRKLADRSFGALDPVGKHLRVDGRDFTVSGVLDNWNPVPKFYRLVGTDPFASEDFFMPFATAIAHQISPEGNVNCSTDGEMKPGFDGLMESECVWVQFWAELASPGDRAAYASYLDSYVAEQKKLGRFARPLNNRTFDVKQWLVQNKVVGDDERLQTWLAFGFLLVCLVNVVGLLLAKFTARSGEIGVRRALGAPRVEVFKQYLTEAGVVGLVGGLVGVALTLGILALMARQSATMKAVAHMDWVMLATAFGVSLLASLLAGLLPTWRACQVRPAVQLKSQ